MSVASSSSDTPVAAATPEASPSGSATDAETGTPQAPEASPSPSDPATPSAGTPGTPQPEPSQPEAPEAAPTPPPTTSSPTSTTLPPCPADVRNHGAYVSSVPVEQRAAAARSDCGK